eukprot:5602672-Alexandrium_andersonii.AAC.1
MSLPQSVIASAGPGSSGGVLSARGPVFLVVSLSWLAFGRGCAVSWGDGWWRAQRRLDIHVPTGEGGGVRLGRGPGQPLAGGLADTAQVIGRPRILSIS